MKRGEEGLGAVRSSEEGCPPHFRLVLPEVEHSQIDAHSSVWNMYRPVHHGDLLLFHRTGPVGLPANHKLTRGLVNADRADTDRISVSAVVD